MLLAALVTSGGCARTLGEAALAPSCKVELAQYAVGQRLDDRLAARILRQTGAKVLRVIHPGEMTTMEFRADRLNARVDANRIVQALNCG